MILYTKRICPKCKMVKKELEVRGIAYEPVNIEEIVAEKEKLQSQGISKLPVMEIDGKYITDVSEMLEVIEEMDEQAEGDK